MRPAPTATLVLLAAGCASTPPPRSPAPATGPASASIPQPRADPLLHAVVCPPLGWRPDPPKVSDRHRHQVWIGPSGRTAYGVIAFRLPLPVGTGLALWGVLREMRRVEGEANLLDRRDDPALPGIRFTAEGGQYTIRGNLTTDGLQGWLVYAGTLRNRPIDAAELKLAEAAREATRVVRP